MRHLARLMLMALLILSLAGFAINLAQIATDPTLRAARTATGQEIRARTDALLARYATPETLTALLETHLAAPQRNWIALDALTDLAIERAIDLSPDLSERLASARSQDFGLWAQAASCALCAFDAGQCSLSQVLACQAPVALTPIGDLLGISHAGVAYASGAQVDQNDLALSVVGLGATAAVLVSGGSSALVKAGAGLAKTARKMGRLSPRLVDLALASVRDGVDWAGLSAVRSLDDLTLVVRAEAFAPLTATLTDLERVRAATDTTVALQLLPLVDDAADARRLAQVAEALGPKVVGRAEVLGKARLFRATWRAAGITLALAGWFGGLALAFAGLVGHWAQGRVLRLIARAAR